MINSVTYVSQESEPGDTTTYNDFGLPIAIINQGKAPNELSCSIQWVHFLN